VDGSVPYFAAHLGAGFAKHERREDVLELFESSRHLFALGGIGRVTNIYGDSDESPNPQSRRTAGQSFTPPLPQPQLMEKFAGINTSQREPACPTNNVIGSTASCLSSPQSANLPGVGRNSAVRSVRRSCFFGFIILVRCLRSLFLV